MSDSTSKDSAGRQAKQPEGTLYRTREVVSLLGISRRQLQYWAQTDLVRPSVQTPGGHARYTFEDLVALKTAKRLIDHGYHPPPRDRTRHAGRGRRGRPKALGLMPHHPTRPSLLRTDGSAGRP